MNAPLPHHVTTQHVLDLSPEIIVDLFAGGGGVSEGVEMALGFPPHVAVNHSDSALSMHRMNHPFTKHHIADVFEICPKAVVAFHRRPVGALHLSPDCTHHSQAAGGQPRNRKIRALSWVGVRWAGHVAPRIMTLENVKQITSWGPLIAKRDPKTGRVVTLETIVDPVTKKKTNRVAEPGERVPLENQFLVPDPKRAGKTWRRFVRILEGMGYKVETRKIIAADLGAGTTRERLYMIARRDGRPIVWPEPTRAKEPKKGQQRWKPAAESIHWDIPCPSIFTRKKPLAPATLKRIAKGMKRYVLDSADPFIVPIAHYNGSEPVHSVQEPLRTVTAFPKGGAFAVSAPTIVPATHQGDLRVHDPRDPLPTITAAHRGELMASSAVMIQAAHGDGQPGRAQRWGDGSRNIEEPIGTITASGGHAVAAAVMVGAGGPSYSGKPTSIEEPVGTILTDNHRGIAAATLIQTGYGERDGQSPRTLDIEQPLGTVVAGAVKHALASAHLVKFRHDCIGTSMDEPVPTITSGGGAARPAGAAHALGLSTAYLMQANGGFNTTSGHDARDPMSTITNSGSQQQVVTAFLSSYYTDESDRCRSPNDPVATVTTANRIGIVEANLATPFLSRQFGNSIGQSVSQPMPTTTAGGGGKTSLVAANLAHLRGNCDARDLNEPVQTISAGGQHHAVVEYQLSPENEAGALRVAAFLMEYYSEGGQWSDVRDPVNTITTKDRLALVTVTIKGTPYVIVDIGLRMLVPRELYNAQGFRSTYIIDHGHDGRKFTKDQQVRMVGNSVPPDVIAAIYRANLGELALRSAA